ncbi:MAG: hypothetical protein WD604_06750 [Balneolaceae bacterium]
MIFFSWPITTLNFTFTPILLDIARRAEDFVLAKSLVKRLLKSDVFFIAIGLFQRHLISSKETNAYTISEAIEYYEKGDFDFESIMKEEFASNKPSSYKPNYKKDAFDALTDGQYGRYDQPGLNNIGDLKDGLGH